jgi:cis-3-alkyl-4-acyloxetan-2-one decarboxylase
MRTLTRIAGAVILGATALYALGMGVYAVASTRSEVPSTPRSAREADEAIGLLGVRSEYPFAHGFATTPHGRMHYVEAGSGAPVLLLHGNSTWSYLYRHLMVGLSGRARLVAPDLIGFGLSSKLARAQDYSVQGHIDDVVALLEELDLRDLTLVVQDWGGPIGLGVLLRAPERVRGLVVLNTFGFSPRMPLAAAGPSLALRAARVPLMGEQLVQGLGVLQRVSVRPSLRGDEAEAARAWRAYSEVQGSWRERAGTLAFERLVPDDGADPAAELMLRAEQTLRADPPHALIVWGMADRFFGRAALEEWKLRLPGADVVELPGVGALVQEEAPDALIGALIRYLDAAMAAPPASS